MRAASGHGLIYLDSSAIVKLVAAERESKALLDFLSSRGPAIASAVARGEVHRAVNRLAQPEDLARRASATLERIALIRIDEAILSSASDLEPIELRTLDAIHLATALSVGDHLDAMVVYDRRLAEAAQLLGLEVVSPA